MQSIVVLWALASACTSPEGLLTSPDPEGPAVVLDSSPPPIAGGTLLVSKDGTTAWVSDPDRDRVWRVDLERGAVLAATALDEGDEPGRIVEDALGRAHVVLRGTGAVATIEPGFAQRFERTPVCPEPRGIAIDPRTQQVHVACTDGTLVTLAADGTVERTLQLDADLRDVVIDGARLVVSQFRSAKLLVVEADGTITQRLSLPTTPSVMPGYYGSVSSFEADVAWRMLAVPDVGLVVVHQRAQAEPVSIESGGYGGGSDYYGGGGSSIVQGAVSVARLGGEPTMTAPGFPGVLPVDVAIASDGVSIAVAAAGSREVYTGVITTVRDSDGYDYYYDDGSDPPEEGPVGMLVDVTVPGGEPVAVAFDGRNHLVVQTREPSRLLVDGVEIQLGGDSHENTGHAFFHHVPEGAVPLACASCHPEGRDDGRVWDFDALGPRRTQTVSGGILRTRPFHWDGLMDGIHMLVTDVVSVRMAGTAPTQTESNELGVWLDGLPAPARPAPTDPSAVLRGEAIFASAGCGSCHAGEALTNNATVDVGTGGAFQVPSLRGVWARAPFLHDGCAPTLADRFGSCGGGDRHGRTSGLDAGQVADLVAFLETL